MIRVSERSQHRGSFKYDGYIGETDGHTFIQAPREARWALGLPLLYLLAWSLAAYLPDSASGITGLPHWFEMACLVVPLLFIGLCWLMVRGIFRDIPLEDGDAN